MLCWSLGLFLLDWFQIPTALFGARDQIVYTQFNSLFSISVPLSFLGFLLIYLGIRAVTHALIKKIVYSWFFLWFLAALIFYGIQNWGTYAIGSRLGLFASVACFFVPVQLLNFSALWAAFRNEHRAMAARTRWGLATLMGSVVVSFARYAFYADQVILYPPQFALVLIRSSFFYLSTQMLGIALLVAGFLLIHKETVRRGMQGAGGMPGV